MRSARLWGILTGLGRGVATAVSFDEQAQAVVVSARCRKTDAGRCGVCKRRCPGYNQGEGPRRWRALDLGTHRAFIEADAPRVRCPDHGVVVSSVPWARHGAGHTLAFDDLVAWCATHLSRSAAGELTRISWRTVGAICARVGRDAREATDLLEGLRRIGIDEVSYRRGQRYLTLVVDHDSGRLIWAADGRDEATLRRFFDELGERRCKQIALVSADGAEWIGGVVSERCVNAELCIDPFHVVAWATKALDEVRREVWNTARRSGQKGLARSLKDARFALWKNPENLTGRQEAKLSWIQQTNRPLYRAYLLKEQLRQVFVIRGEEGIALLDAWLVWARRCRLGPFVKLARTIGAYREGIANALRHGLSNARVESVNTRIRLLTRIAFGFRSPEALISVAMLSLSGLCPPLPGRAS